VLKQIINQDEEPKSEDRKKEGSADSSSSSNPSSESRSTSKRFPPMTGSKNILSSDVEIRGNLRFSNDLIIDGRIEGETNSLLEKTPRSMAISKLSLLSFSAK